MHLYCQQLQVGGQHYDCCSQLLAYTHCLVPVLTGRAVLLELLQQILQVRVDLDRFFGARYDAHNVTEAPPVEL
jgi:hypothetical protein